MEAWGCNGNNKRKTYVYGRLALKSNNKYNQKECPKSWYISILALACLGRWPYPQGGGGATPRVLGHQLPRPPPKGPLANS